MTLNEIGDLVVSVDPKAGHYESADDNADAYTYWQELRPVGLFGDDVRAEEAWAFMIHRFSKMEGDAIAAMFYAALQADDRVAFDYNVDYEHDTGYIHHIFSCEAM